MSRMVDDLITWIKQYRSGKVWLAKLKSRETVRVYLPNFKVFCDAVEKNPDELINFKMEGQRNVGQENEFQMEELHDLTINEMEEATAHVKANISMSVISFFKHNRRPLVGIKRFDRPTAKRRTPSLNDIEEMANCCRTRRDEALVWFLTTAPFRDGSLENIKWSDFRDTEDANLPLMLNIEAERLKGSGKGKYKGVRQICFINYWVKEKLDSYYKEAKRKGITITGARAHKS